GIFPTLIGFSGDMGRFSMGIGLAGGLILCGTIVAYFLKFPVE
ncbi:MAG: MFS transporter, partial [Deltaproteobacteria bacterium]|nr:MFS transporter [Deltaproteobacteria bacterium]